GPRIEFDQRLSVRSIDARVRVTKRALADHRRVPLAHALPFVTPYVEDVSEIGAELVEKTQCHRERVVVPDRQPLLNDVRYQSLTAHLDRPSLHRTPLGRSQRRVRRNLLHRIAELCSRQKDDWLDAVEREVPG